MRRPARRESAWGALSIISQHLPAAQLELGLVLRDDLHRRADALAAFAGVEKNYPQSTVQGDALYEIAATQAATGDSQHASQSLASRARRFPDSKFELELAPVLARKLGCI